MAASCIMTDRRHFKHFTWAKPCVYILVIPIASLSLLESALLISRQLGQSIGFTLALLASSAITWGRAAHVAYRSMDGRLR